MPPANPSEHDRISIKRLRVVLHLPQLAGESACGSLAAIRNDEFPRLAGESEIEAWPSFESADFTAATCLFTEAKPGEVAASDEDKSDGARHASDKFPGIRRALERIIPRRGGFRGVASLAAFLHRPKVAVACLALVCVQLAVILWITRPESPRATNPPRRGRAGAREAAAPAGDDAMHAAVQAETLGPSPNDEAALGAREPVAPTWHEPFAEIAPEDSAAPLDEVDAVVAGNHEPDWVAESLEHARAAAPTDEDADSPYPADSIHHGERPRRVARPSQDADQDVPGPILHTARHRTRDDGTGHAAPKPPIARIIRVGPVDDDSPGGEP